MKKIYTLVLILFSISTGTIAQQSGEITPRGIVYPRYTTANRPTGSITPGTTIFNTTLNTHQYYNGSTWVSITNATGASPWTLTGSFVHNNSGSRVGINAPKPAADLEIQGGGGLLVSSTYTVTSSPPAAAITMPYSGTLPVITSLSGRILDPGGTGNYSNNTAYHSYVRLDPTGTSIGFRFTLEILALAGGDELVLSTSSDINDESSKILSITPVEGYPTGSPFTIKGGSIYIHFRIYSGPTPAAGFQLLFETVTNVVQSGGRAYSEFIGDGLSYSPYYRSFSTGFSRATGFNSTAFGESLATGYKSIAMPASTASSDYSVAIGASTANAYSSTAIGRATASGQFSVAIGNQARTRLANTVAIGHLADANAENSMVLSGYGAFSNTPYELVAAFKTYRFFTKQDKSTYVTLSEGSGSWTGVSDSTKKERHIPVNVESVLNKIADLKLTSWNFKNSTSRHYGPMAQDFYAAFGKDDYGTIGSDTTINSGDFDGINLIAIQALEKRTKNIQNKYDEQIASIRNENAQLAAEVNELKQSLRILYKKHEELLNKMEAEKIVHTDPE